MSDIEELEQLRKKIREYNELRMQLTGELKTHQNSLQEIESKCEDEFDVEVKELPSLIEELEGKATEAMNKARGLLDGNN